MLGRSADDNSQHLSPSCLGGSVAARTHQYCALFADCLDYLIYRLGWAGTGNSGTGAVEKLVQAAQAMGGKPFYIILRHVLPQTASYVIILRNSGSSGFIVAESVLSLIGLEFSSLTLGEICYRWQRMLRFYCRINFLRRW